MHLQNKRPAICIDQGMASAAFHLLAGVALRVQFVGHLDVILVRSGDFEGEACGRKLKEPQREVAGVGIVIVRLL
jgi:hypothetical protein